MCFDSAIQGNSLHETSQHAHHHPPVRSGPAAACLHDGEHLRSPHGLADVVFVLDAKVRQRESAVGKEAALRAEGTIEQRSQSLKQTRRRVCARARPGLSSLNAVAESTLSRKPWTAPGRESLGASLRGTGSMR